ncbi:MAG: 2-oxoglutarate dehydrogenase complex dihydrolipoyllysine-residue succinyltransferase [Planctomycetota bacterium]
MPTELIVPEVGESITEVEIGAWQVQEGQAVKKDAVLVEIETDKVTQELYAPADGVVAKIAHAQGDNVAVGTVIGTFEAGDAPQASETKDPPAEKDAASPNDTEPAADDESAPARPDPSASLTIMPAAQRLINEHNLDPAQLTPTGPGHRLLKEDVQNFLKNGTPAPEKSAPQGTAPSKPASSLGKPSSNPSKSSAGGGGSGADSGADSGGGGDRAEEVVPMTSLRKRIAANLVDAQQTAALLTTFNEIDMTAVMALRSQYKDQFLKVHDVKLGFMSFFVKASIDALKQSPAINAEVRGTDIIYKNYYDIGIAIGGGKGLVVPILRNAERMSFADVEKNIGDYAAKAKANKLQLSDLTGGTFTITNGGIYGSLLSTPIVNPPQSGVLGMHGIVRRPIAVHPGTPQETIEVRPMMYVALTYDHRIVDGREAVTCLKRIKDTLEAPARMLMEV